MSDFSSNNNPQNSNATSFEQLQKQHMKQFGDDESSFVWAVTAGLLAALIGALIWAGITYATDFQIGWMAVGVGFLVGFSIKQFGKSSEIHFGIAGGVLSLVGCLFGNLFTSVIFIASAENMGVFDVLFQIDFSIMTEILTDTFHPMDLLFYGLSVYYGFKYSIAVEEIDDNKETTTPQPPIQN